MIDNKKEYKFITGSLGRKAKAVENMEEFELEKRKSPYNTSELSLNIQELDRQRIARDLHDSSLQTLAHLIHKLELSSQYIDKDVIQAKLEIASVTKSMREVIQEIRNIIFDLRPMSFDDLGLKDSLENLLDTFCMNSQMEIRKEIQDITCTDEGILMGIFRIVQECCNNAVRYSRGTKLSVMLKEKENQIFLEIEDNGVGFDIEEMEGKEKHFGLAIIKERVSILSGKIEIFSEKGKGTKYCVVLPI